MAEKKVLKATIRTLVNEALKGYALAYMLESDEDEVTGLPTHTLSITWSDKTTPMSACTIYMEHPSFPDTCLCGTLRVQHG